MRIVGIDIGNGLAVCCPLDAMPTEPRQFYIDGASYFHFNADAEGIKGLLELEPDIAILEPTGVNYSRLWGTHLARAGIEVRLVAHAKLKGFREELELPDKDDEFDAYALGCYGWKYLEQPRRFLQVREQPITRIRELVLRLAHLNRVQSPIINRMRQDLAWQFPEVSKIKSQRITELAPLLWRWLAGKAKSKKYDEMYKSTCGLGLTDTVRLHAERLCDLQNEEVMIEKELHLLISDPAFFKYRKVLTQFGFGFRNQALIISQIFPFENFLDGNNKPIVVIRKGRKSKKPTKRYLSRRRFEKALGVAPTQDASGKKDKKQVIGGSDLCRKGFWQWIYTRIKPMNARKNNPICCQIHHWMNDDDRKGTPHRLLMMKTAATAARLLFKALVAEFQQ